MTRVVVLGDVMVDVVARLEGPVAPGSDSPARVVFQGGGQAANTAAWLGVAGAEVALVGRVGADASGRAAAEELAALGVDARLAVDSERPTGTCVVLVAADGERTMFPDAGRMGRWHTPTSPTTSSPAATISMWPGTPFCAMAPGRPRRPPLRAHTMQA
jgi:sugar/nucleoside kinase (ribokinase family)